MATTSGTVTSIDKPDFIPLASIIAFVVIGVVFLAGIVARFLAFNQSIQENLDLMIYKAAPRPPPIGKANRMNNANLSESISSNGIQKSPPLPAARGPKNL
ncbi:unnamed protein product [Didymodactylos carnosus]|uniref:Uncharacterized protein n=1 Tax=Didymodactylos carnosus TaxID=1234261 RepID=A0A813VTM3_9BILA|nr:unnamed protein product [Didymodactylos carnosus]CAF3635635.1 unnamed protein product [Didymodactylos carnosus]